MKVVRGISFVIALLGIVAAVILSAFSVIFLVGMSNYESTGPDDWSGFALVAIFLYTCFFSACAYAVSGVAAILPAFSYNSFVKTTSRVIFVADIIFLLISVIVMLLY